MPLSILSMKSQGKKEIKTRGKTYSSESAHSHESFLPLRPIPIQALYCVAHFRLALRLLHRQPTHHHLTRRRYLRARADFPRFFAGCSASSVGEPFFRFSDNLGFFTGPRRRLRPIASRMAPSSPWEGLSRTMSSVREYFFPHWGQSSHSVSEWSVVAAFALPLTFSQSLGVDETETVSNPAWEKRQPQAER